MDWGLLEMKSGDNKFLREETVYSSNVGHSRIIIIRNAGLGFQLHLQFSEYIYIYLCCI